jgi:hypothetical protein
VTGHGRSRGSTGIGGGVGGGCGHQERGLPPDTAFPPLPCRCIWALPKSASS